MRNGSIVGLCLLLAGAALLFWGAQASESLASSFSMLFQGEPSDKAIWLVIVGALAAMAGIAKLSSSRTAP
jgi:hypothetical protein